MNFKPVIFLAFANDKVDNTAYLRNLSMEQRGIRNALAEAVSKGLCEVIERSSTTISDILDVFQDPIYGPRISIFHYGGHADGFSLLLESEDGTKALTHKEGLVPFFARQENLKLIFLNGCSSEGQATDLLKAGIPAVIGTTASINDEIATALATRFYSSLGDGSSIEKAWADATDEVKIKNGTGNTRALYWQGKQEVSDRFPWVIQFKPGAEIIKEWNLPDISGNPLYGLPDIPQSYNLPESPFLYLNRYERKHAEVFFGRSYYVRSLFSSVADSQGPPIILLCGQSGTGKSSLLEAGLQPRLESRYEIIYLRRNGIIGLSATLFNALLEKCGFKPDVSVITETRSYSELDNLKQFVANLSDTIKSELQPIIEKLSSSNKSNTPVTPIQDQKPSSLPAAWNLVEKKLDKPLLVILDQLEEAYTRPNASLGNEMNQLFLDLKSVFGNPATLPKGKILLSYRKEYQPEIEEYCKKYELSRSKVFIEHISKNDIVELFQGFMTSPRLMSRYHLTIEKGLPELIAEDLVADKEAPVAPVLQILLTKMWYKAVELNSQAPAFTHDLYHELKEKGLAMDEFLVNQLQAIKKKLPEAHDLGFVLDMLAFHCTANNTSAARTEKELLAHYPFSIDAAKKVLAACKESFLITDLGGNEHSSMLAHDTLAKSVVKAQQRSTQPIQQGKRILSSRIEAIKAGSKFATMDSWELKLIEKIQMYLPAFDEGEKKLFDDSRKEITKQEKQRQRIVNSSRIIIALSILSGIVAWYLYAQSKKHEKASFVSLMTVSSGMNIVKDPTLAIQQALSGLEKDSTSIELKKMLLTAYYHSDKFKLAWYNIIYKSDKQLTDLIYNDRVDLMIPVSSSDTLDIISAEGKIAGNLIAEKARFFSKEKREVSDKNYFFELKWSYDGQHIIAMDDASSLYFFDKTGKVIKFSNYHLYEMFDFNDSSKNVVALEVKRSESSFDYWLDFFDFFGNKLDSIKIDLIGEGPRVESARYSGSGKNIFINASEIIERFPGMTENIGKLVELMDLNGKKVFSNLFPHTMTGDVFCSPSDHLFAVAHLSNQEGSYGESGTIWNRNGDSVSSTKRGPLDIKNILFHPSDSFYLILQGGKVSADFIPIKKSISFIHQKDINTVRFSPKYDLVLTGGLDNLGKVSKVDGTLCYSLFGHTLPLTGIDMDVDEKTAYTSSLDGTVRSWKLPDLDQFHISIPEKIDSFCVDPSGNFLFLPLATPRLNHFYDLRSHHEYNWKSLMNNTMDDKYYFLDSNLLVGVTNAIVRVFRPEVDSIIYLSKRKWELNANNYGDYIGSTVIHVGLENNQIITVYYDSIRFWNRDGKYIKSIISDSINNNLYKHICFSSDHSLFAFPTIRENKNKSQDTLLILYDQFGVKQKEFKSKMANFASVKFSNKGDKIVSFSDNGSVQIHSMKGQSSIFNKREDCKSYGGCSILDFHFSADDAQMISSTSDGLIRIWDSTANLINSFQSDMTLRYADFTPDGKMIYAYDADSTLKLWDLQGNFLYTYKGHTAFFTKDGNRLYTIKKYQIANNKTRLGSELRDYLTPQGAYNYFKSNKTFQKSSDNNFFGKYWHKLLEWLKLD